MVIHKYLSDSGRDFIMEYIDSLPEEERIDGLSVLECMENGEFDKIRFKRWDKRYMKCISGNITECFILQ